MYNVHYFEFYYSESFILVLPIMWWHKILRKWRVADYSQSYSANSSSFFHQGLATCPDLSIPWPLSGLSMVPESYIRCKRQTLHMLCASEESQSV